MIQYEQFYRQFGVRNAGQLLQPPLPTVARFQLPPMSIVHYPGSGPMDQGPNDQGMMYQSNTKPLRIDHIFNFATTLGGPKRIQSDTASEIRKFRERNPRFRPMLDLDLQKRDPYVIGTYNYAFLMRMFRFQRTLFTLQNRLSNVVETMFKKIGEVKESGYNQYLEINIPETLPTLENLKKAANGWNSQTIQIFNSYEMILLLELYKWLGADRRNSMIYKYIGDRADGIHLVFKVADRFTVLNLQLFNSWRKSTEEETAIWRKESIADPSLPKPNNTGVDTVQIQKRLLRLMMAVTAVRGEDIDENLGDEGLQSAADAVDSRSDDPATPQANVDTSGDTEESAFRGNTDEIDQLNLSAIVDDDIDMLDEINASFQRYSAPTIEKAELDQMDGVLPEEDVKASEASVTDIINSPVTTKEIEYFPTDPDKAFTRLLDQAAASGNITAAEYLKLSNMNAEFGNIPAPLGFEGSLKDFVEITPEMVAIKEAPSIPDRDTIVDKSMLKSSLINFNARYSKEILLRDVLGAVTNLRRGGVIIRDVRVERVKTISDDMYQIAVDVKPIVGAATTLSMRIPVVDEAGDFVSGGVKYRTRMQRNDLPIRKISPSRVALTTNYGKIFVDRSEKRTADYGKWIRSAIMAQGLSNRNDAVTHIVPGKAFENKEVVPRLFSMLAMGFRGFTLKVKDRFYQINLVASEAEKVDFGTQGGMIVLGSSESGQKLVMDKDSTLYILSGDTIELLPSLEVLLGLNALKAPIEFAEVTIFSQPVSVGVVLGYLLGFENLLKMLDVKNYRVVPTGKRLGLVPGEYAIVFDDETLVFSKTDELATMILAGWREFDQTTTRFNRAEFSKKDVYFNMFEEKKLSARYVNEMDNLERIFIDPISRELLRDMEEPEVFTHLLQRASELITTDYHPDEQDAMLMRERGYERFANFAYTELVRAYRIHGSRPGKHRYGIDLNPYAVSTAIQKDPAKDQVAEINPIQNLKEIEAVTYSGTGGRGSRSMVKSTRVFHEHDKGIASESTVDSSNVAINIFTTANPKFASLRGTHELYDFEKDGPTSLLSTSALVSPGSTRDDQYY